MCPPPSISRGASCPLRQRGDAVDEVRQLLVQAPVKLTPVLDEEIFG